MVKVDSSDRIAHRESGDQRVWIGVLAAVFGLAAIGVVAVPALRQSIVDGSRNLAASAGLIEAPKAKYADTLKRLGIGDLPARVLTSEKVSAALARIDGERCDRTAIFSLGQALMAAKEQRAAAYAYFGFAATCPNGEAEEYRAAQILLDLGDLDKTIALADTLIDQNPRIGNYRYVRGKALASKNRYKDALIDYRSTIELENNPRRLAEHFFVEMANIFRALGQPCDAARTILVWVALDPATRNTMAARRMIQDYAGGHCRGVTPPDDPKKL